MLLAALIITAPLHLAPTVDEPVSTHYQSAAMPKRLLVSKEDMRILMRVSHIA
jgi:hypothetical protein